MDGGAWKAAVHGVARSWTRLSDFTFPFHFHALEKEMAAHSSVLAWRIPGTREPGGLPSLGSHRVRHDWSDLAATTTAIKIKNISITPKSPFVPFCNRYPHLLQAPGNHWSASLLLYTGLHLPDFYISRIIQYAPLCYWFSSCDVLSAVPLYCWVLFHCAAIP